MDLKSRSTQVISSNSSRTTQEVNHINELENNIQAIIAKEVEIKEKQKNKRKCNALNEQNKNNNL